MIIQTNNRPKALFGQYQMHCGVQAPPERKHIYFRSGVYAARTASRAAAECCVRTALPLNVHKVGRFAFHYTDSVGTPDFEQISGLNCLMTLSPDFLRLARRVTTSYSRFATGGAVTPYQAGFPPAKCCALCWAHLYFRSMPAISFTVWAVCHRRAPIST